jgi:pyridoxal phosphate enzyme (YggS family)
MSRLEELSLNWTQTVAQIDAACLSANRSFTDIAIIAVTKTWPASDVDLLAHIGVTNVGENRDQEAAAKKLEVKASNLTWHAIGQVQTNKVKSIVQWADAVHSVDRIELVHALAKAMPSRNRPLEVFIQINLDPQIREERGGLRDGDLLEIAEQICAVPGLNLMGVMGVAPLDGDAAEAFAALERSSLQLRQQIPSALYISAGMSSDYEIALKYGATHLRLGSVILGHR